MKSKVVAWICACSPVCRQRGPGWVGGVSWGVDCKGNREIEGQWYVYYFDCEVISTHVKVYQIVCFKCMQFIIKYTSTNWVYERKISLGVLTSCGSPIAAGRRGPRAESGDKAALGHLAGGTHTPGHLPGSSVLSSAKAENVPKDGSDCIWIIIKVANNPTWIKTSQLMYLPLI